MFDSIFLGGSTAKGDWQQKIIAAFQDVEHVNFINTCRPDWDVTEPTRQEKNEHIEWEFQMLSHAEFVFICIPADAKSPTVALELGIALADQGREGNLVVFIDPAYSHFHNLRIACGVEHVEVHTNFDDAVAEMKDLFLTYL